ncbi:MAG TPA: beta-galactosidase [Microvirga sp.]|jgi:beta-galactosidase|nr:beta-galactosidase [Microvirga sp.]
MLGVCYYPEHWPEDWWREDARRMRDLGIDYVRIGEFAWSRIEPESGRFEWAWLDRAMDVLHEAGLRIVLGTPTATPPKWLIDRHPDILPVDEKGQVRGFGSRRHYSFSAPAWIEESRRIVEAVARRYGEHPGLAGWQTDNEYGCHDTILSWGAHDLAAFKGWLRRRYQTPDQLNEAWGNVFWSMELTSFDEVYLPNLSVTEANPAARLDFWRFSSEQVVAYNRMQADILRRHSPGRFVTHNFMGLFHDFDHWDVGEDLDFATWDSYPIGFTERFPFTEEERVRYARTAHPDMAPFHHDLYRGVGRGRWWVMEQQPGPVNWAPWNPVPRKGQIRLFTWEALAHGAEVVSYFRWRQAPFAQEQHHAGLNRPDRTLSPGGEEARQVARELKALGELPPAAKAPVALVFDYEASWITRIQPQGRDFDYAEMTYRWYEAARRLGLDIDVVRPGASLDGYRLVLVPTLPHVTGPALSALRDAGGTVLFGPRSGSRTRNFVIPDTLAPGPLQDLLPIRVTQVSSLRPGLRDGLSGAVEGTATRWREDLEVLGDASVEARFEDGAPALVSADGFAYCAAWCEGETLGGLMRWAAGRAGLDVLDLPADIRLRRRGPLNFAFNYGTESWPVPAAPEALVLGSPMLAPGEVAVWRGAV